MFVKYDEDKSGGIELGIEFDGFLTEFYGYLNEIRTLPRDQLREMFGNFDTNSVTLDQFWPNALSTFKKAGYIIDMQEIELSS